MLRSIRKANLRPRVGVKPPPMGAVGGWPGRKRPGRVCAPDLRRSGGLALLENLNDSLRSHIESNLFNTLRDCASVHIKGGPHP